MNGGSFRKLYRCLCSLSLLPASHLASSPDPPHPTPTYPPVGQLLHSAAEPLWEAEVKTLMWMLLKGLAFCHGSGIIHRVRA